LKGGGAENIARARQLLKRAAGPMSNPGIFELTRQRAAEARAAAPRPEPLSVMARRLGILRSL
jgi:hypothetical protein